MGAGHRIKRVLPGGIAEEMGVEPGMSIIAVNGQEIQDVFDYQYLMEDLHVDILIREESGEETLLEVDRDPDEDFGVEFESSLMDDYKSCSNHCIFCFIDQMPKGMRETLYFKDDDSRLSFLQGNYVTLTNMKERDLDRIIRLRMEPINISVHTTNPALRRKMLGNRFAGDIMEKLGRLRDAGIEMNGQIVLCRGINDGAELDRTIRELGELRPAMKSLSVVPVGITRFREHLPKLETFDRESSAQVIDQIESWQKKFREDGVNPEIPNFVQASDEWYLSAGREVPEEERYDGYLQLENGVGMVRLLKNETRTALKGLLDRRSSLYRSLTLPEKDYLSELPARGRHVTTICGRLIEPVIRELAAEIMGSFPGLSIRVVPIRNDFFGHTITVSGLITGQDLIAQLKELVGNEDPADVLGEEILLPVNMLRSGERVFLDDLTVDDVENTFRLPVGVIWSGGEELVRSVLGLSHREEGDRQVYESWEPDAQ